MQFGHNRLWENIQELGELLGQTLKRLHGDSCLELVEKVRLMAKEARLESESESLKEKLFSLSDQEVLMLARAFYQFLAQANIAEQQHRIRRKRFYESRKNAAPQKLSIEAMLGELKIKGLSNEALQEKLGLINIDLVLTAHPTELMRRTLIRKYNKIAHALGELDQDDLGAFEEAELKERLRRLVESIWITEELRPQRPTPIDEVKGALSLVEDTFWRLLPRFMRRLNWVLKEKIGLRPLGPELNPFRISSWIGGDRDGNPYVTASSTREALERAHALAKKLYLQDIRELIFFLSGPEATAEFRAELKDPDEPEPYRAYLRTLYSDLDHGQIITSAELYQRLEKCRNSLVSVGAKHIARGPLEDLMRRVKIFGLELLSLDIRQSAQVHREALAPLMEKLFPQAEPYLELSSEMRFELLEKALSLSENTLDQALEKIPPKQSLRDMLETLSLRHRFGERSLSALIVSQCEHSSDLLEAELLLKLSHGKLDASKNPPVVPLLESSEALERSKEIVAGYLDSQHFKSDSHKKLLQVMLGYSDSAKAAGRFASAWQLHQAQEDLSALCHDRGVQVIYFHGRGGSIGRGGGPTYYAMQALPAQSMTGTFRVTEQGEALQAKFGLDGVAMRSLELYLSGSLELLSRVEQESPPEKYTRMAKLLAAESANVFRAYVYETPNFVDFFRLVSPVDELSSVRAGSRPAKRKASPDLDSLRAIPWVFAWTQNRSLMASWLGIGEALEELQKQGHGPLLSEMYRKWPFFSSTLSLIEMVLAKADTKVFRLYSIELLEEASQQEIAQKILKSYTLSCEQILKVSGAKALLELNPQLAGSIRARNPYVDPLHLIQVHCLKRLRDEPEKRLNADSPLNKALLTTMLGIASGLRNTG